MRHRRALRFGFVATVLVLGAVLDAAAYAAPARVLAAHGETRSEARTANELGLDGLGRSLASAIPRSAHEVVLVAGAGVDSSTDVVTLWRRDASGWREVGGPVRGHNGAAGWTDAHEAGDERTPIGIFSLTEAGGALANPGTRLPYEHNLSYYSHSMYTGDGPSKVFDYLVAINFNRLASTPPSDPVEPLGTAVGGGIWLHVDDGRPTAGCVSIPQADMVPSS
jgi:L,D-peptidoglycan transpeptidase YkuD (ErfK/YbiS/YcfS/YnhG family)